MSEKQADKDKNEQATDDGEAAAQNEEAAPSKTKGLLRSALAIAVVYALSAGVAFFVLPAPDPDPHAGAHAQEEHEEKEAETTRVSYEVPTVLVNLAGSNGKRYLKAGIVISYTTRNPDKAAEGIEEKKALLRDALITLLSSKDQRSVDGREKLALLKLEISEELNKVLFPDELAEVDTVYFQEFIVQ